MAIGRLLDVGLWAPVDVLFVESYKLLFLAFFIFYSY